MDYPGERTCYEQALWALGGTTQNSVMIRNHRITLSNQTQGPYKFCSEMSGREWKSLKALKAGYVNVVLQHTFAITLVDSSPSTCLWTKHTFQKYLWLSHTDLVLSNKSKWNSWRKTLRLWQSADTHEKKSFFQLKIARIPLWNSLSHTTYCFLIMCVDIFQTDLS